MKKSITMALLTNSFGRQMLSFFANFCHLFSLTLQSHLVHLAKILQKTPKISFSKQFINSAILCVGLLSFLSAEDTVDLNKAEEAIDIVSGLEDQKGEDAKEEANLYEIKVSEQEGEIINEILSTMGSSTVLALGFKRTHLKALGQKITGIGSLQFLGYIAEKSDLKKHLKTIHSSSFKWRGFMDGLKPGLEKEADKETLFAEIPSFAKRVNADAGTLVQLAKERKWEEFVMQAVNP